MPFTDFGVKDNALYRITRGRFTITSVSKYNDINDSWDYAVPDTEEFVRSLRMLSYPDSVNRNKLYFRLEKISRDDMESELDKKRMVYELRK